MKKKIHKNLTNSQIEELSGFKDVLDLFFESNINVVPENRRDELSKVDDSYGLYNFLNNEYNRLLKLDNLLSVVIPNIQSNSLTHNLIERQKKVLDDSKEKAAKRIIKDDSVFIKNISELFNAAF